MLPIIISIADCKPVVEATDNGLLAPEMWPGLERAIFVDDTDTHHLVIGLNRETSSHRQPRCVHGSMGRNPQ
jgi:hypothetical protein